MKFSQVLLLLLIAGVAGWLILGGPGNNELGRWLSSGTAEVQPSGNSSNGGSVPSKPTVRVASLNPGPLDAYKVKDSQIITRLADLVAQFDIVALQDVRGPGIEVLVSLVDRLNAEGRRYDYVIDPAVERNPVRRYLAFVFDTDTVTVDRRAVYSVLDPTGTFRPEPLAAAFMTRGPAKEEAFTFTLVNVLVDPIEAEKQMALLPEVIEAVRDDGRGEDDVILLGTIPKLEGGLPEIRPCRWLIDRIPTTTDGSAVSDNILIDYLATVEYTGRAGLVDVARRFELQLAEAVRTTAHLPVWAEFSVFEGVRSVTP